MTSARQAIFISHATPDDNQFTLWLGGKLTALGYEVFADILRLKGGDDWERILEDAIREKAAKFLLVATPHGVQKQGVRNEITIAAETGKKIGDDSFIIPLRLGDYAKPLQIAHAQYIDFEKNGWSAALSDLLTLLQEAGVTVSATPERAQGWQALQLKDERTIGAGPESLISNWLLIDKLPLEIFFIDFKGGISIGAAQVAMNACPIPIGTHNRGFVSFAPLHQLQDYFGPNLPLEIVQSYKTEDFLNSGWPAINMLPRVARPKFTDLSRRALDLFFESKGLKYFENANGSKAWWPTLAKATKNQLPFAWADGPSGRRQIVGQSEKRGFHWHYGVSCWARSGPVRHVRVGGRVIFTSNGHEVIGDARRLHRMRRTFCKGWRNDKWRDLLLAFLFWVSDGAEFIDVPFGEDAAMRLRLPPLTLIAPFGVNSAADASSTDEDDDDLIVDHEGDDDGDFDDEE